jgi:DNA-binding response OmpR family regulator
MRILIIEDDNEQCTVLKFRLEKEGFSSDVCNDGEDADHFLQNNSYDIILLDRMLPHRDGLTILNDIRRYGLTTPVIMVTALGEINDRISGLDNGADDYIVKPYDFQELMAHIRCRLRRPSNIENIQELSFGDLTYKANENVITGPNGSCTLSNKENELFEIFFHNHEQTITRKTLLSKIWGADYEIEDGNLDNYIYFLRRRLKNLGSSLSIKTIRGVGYRLMKEET